VKKTAEQEARDLLERMNVDGAQSMSSGDLVELANLIATVRKRSPKTADEPRTYTEEQAKEALRVAVRELNDAIGALAAFGIDTGFDVVDVSDPRHAAPQYSLTAVLRRRFEEGELERI
jgi:uncharacterized protein with PIN domain